MDPIETAKKISAGMNGINFVANFCPHSATELNQQEYRLITDAKNFIEQLTSVDFYPPIEPHSHKLISNLVRSLKASLDKMKWLKRNNVLAFNIQNQFAMAIASFAKNIHQSNNPDNSLNISIEVVESNQFVLQEARKVLYHVIAEKGFEVKQEHRERIDSCQDTATVEQWLEQWFTAKTIDDVLGTARLEGEDA